MTTYTRNILFILGGIAVCALLIYGSIHLGNRSLLAQTIPSPTTYYVASSGDDSNSGTSPDKPIQTLSKVATLKLNPGDSVLFNKGDMFYGALSVINSGTPGNPITYGAYGTGNKPVISGFTTLSDWKSIGNNIYEAPCPQCGSTVNMVTLNGSEEAMGRFPNGDAGNGGYLTYTGHTGTIGGGNTGMTVTGTTSITDKNLTEDWTGAEVVIRTRRWDLVRHTIMSQSGGVITYNPIVIHNANSNSTNTIVATNNDNPTDGYGYFIQNSLKTLDENGEWYYNPTTKAMDMYLNSDPTSNLVEVSSVDILANLNNQNYVTFNDVAFTGSNLATISVENTNNIIIQSVSISFSGINGIKGVNNDHVIIQNSSIDHSNNAGIYLGPLNWARLTAGATNALISDNTLTNNGMFAGLGNSCDESYESIILRGNNGVIEKNQITNTGYVPINFNGNGSIIQNNYISDFGTVKDDTGGIYTWYYPSGLPITSRIEISGNYIADGKGTIYGLGNPTGGSANGIYIDDSSYNAELKNNTIVNMSRSGIFLHHAHDIEVHDNTVSNASAQFEIMWNGPSVALPIRDIFVRNNIFISSGEEPLLLLRSDNNDLSSFGAFSSNTYIHPTSSSSLFNIANKILKFSDWQSTYSYDTDSKDITSDDYQFLSNPTSSLSTVPLNGSYVDIAGATHLISATIPAYGSLVLFKGTLPSITPSSLPRPTNTSSTPPTSDTTPPVITLSGPNPDSVTEGSSYTDPGASATDDTDGDLSSHISVSGAVDTNTPNTYTLTYSVTDTAGNTAHATRTVIVNPQPVQTPPSGGGGGGTLTLISSPPSVAITVNQPISAPVSNILQFNVSTTPQQKPQTQAPTPKPSTKQSTPAVKSTPPSSPEISTSKPATSLTQAQIDAHTTIVSIDYTLDDAPIHTTTSFPDTWTFDTTTVTNGAHIFRATYHYADATTRDSITLFTVQNGKTIVESVTGFIDTIWEGVLGLFGR